MLLALALAVDLGFLVKFQSDLAGYSLDAF
jgi:hypothetical protein